MKRKEADEIFKKFTPFRPIDRDVWCFVVQFEINGREVEMQDTPEQLIELMRSRIRAIADNTKLEPEERHEPPY